MPDDVSLSLKVCESDVLVTKAREDGHLSSSKENKSDVSLPYFYGAQTFPDPIDSQVNLQCWFHPAKLSRLPSQLPSRYKFLYFSPPTGAIKFPQLSCLAHWACSVGASRKEGVPVLQ